MAYKPEYSKQELTHSDTDYDFVKFSPFHKSSLECKLAIIMAAVSKIAVKEKIIEERSYEEGLYNGEIVLARAIMRFMEKPWGSMQFTTRNNKVKQEVAAEEPVNFETLTDNAKEPS